MHYIHCMKVLVPPITASLVPLAPLVPMEAFAAEPLLSQLDLIAEGTAMKNCLASSDAFAHVDAGRLMIFSVHGAERLTLSLLRFPDHGMWQLHELEGIAGAEPTAAALIWAHQLVAKVNLNCRHALLAMPGSVASVSNVIIDNGHGDGHGDADDETAACATDTASPREARDYNADLYLKVAATIGRSVPVQVWMANEWKVAVDGCHCQTDEHVVMHWRTLNDDAHGKLLLHGAQTRMAECFVEHNAPGSKPPVEYSKKAFKTGFVMRVLNERVRYA